MIEEGIDVTPGKHIKRIGNVDSFDDCAKKAAEIKEAKFWTYQPSTKNCWPKASNSKKVPLEGVVSGNVECGTAAAGNLVRDKGPDPYFGFINSCYKCYIPRLCD